MLSLILALTPVPVDLDRVGAYIRSQWDASIRSNVHESYIVPIPFRHTVPSPAGNFKALFYWDTYFTNLGLLRSDRLDLARSNCDALLWWIDRLGFVPNSAFVGDDNRSQPPLLSAMVRDVYEASNDKAWLEQAVPRLEREYRFWTTERTFPGGLAHFGQQATEAYLERFYDGTLHSRLGLRLDVPLKEKLSVARNRLAEAESGEDFTPVYGGQAPDYADVKLNSILWVCESNLAYFSRVLGRGSEAAVPWDQRANARAEAVRTQLWDAKSGLFRDRNMLTHEFAPIASLDAFYPLWAGIATPEQAGCMAHNLRLFERARGLAQTEPYQGGTYQWAYPNGWPPTHWIVVSGLKRYGFESDARRVASEYCASQCSMFNASAHLWEKFDVTTGKPSHGEYAPDPMLGWTAGVFLALSEYLERRDPANAR